MAACAAVTWVLDLDGVVWLADEPIPGAAEAVARLRDRGERVVFATNNSGPLVADHEAKLAAMGIPAEGDVLTSAMAAARLVSPGERVLVVGGPGIVEAVTAAGAVPVEDGDGDVDVVAVGLHAGVRLRHDCGAQPGPCGGAPDCSAPTTTPPTPRPTARSPGRGRCWPPWPTPSGVSPVVAGKPHPPMADLVRAVGGPAGTVVGDRPDTDGALGPPARLPLRPGAHRRDPPRRPAGHARAGRGGRQPGCAGRERSVAAIGAAGRGPPAAVALAGGRGRRRGATEGPHRQRHDHPEHEAADVGHPRHAGVRVGEELEHEPEAEHPDRPERRLAR